MSYNVINCERGTRMEDHHFRKFTSKDKETMPYSCCDLSSTEFSRLNFITIVIFKKDPFYYCFFLINLFYRLYHEGISFHL